VYGRYKEKVITQKHIQIQRECVLFRERQLQAKCVFMEDTKRRLLLKKQIQRECILSSERNRYRENVYGKHTDIERMLEIIKKDRDT